MFRFARLAEGEWVVASSGGRGYYVHRDPVCVERAMAPKALGRLMGAAAAARLRADLGVATTGAF